MGLGGGALGFLLKNPMALRWWSIVKNGLRSSGAEIFSSGVAAGGDVRKASGRSPSASTNQPESAHSREFSCLRALFLISYRAYSQDLLSRGNARADLSTAQWLFHARPCLLPRSVFKGISGAFDSSQVCSKRPPLHSPGMKH